MDRLDLALRRYAQIVAGTGPDVSQMQAEELATWLELDVCGIVDTLWEHAGFRDRVRWPVESLCGQQNQRERRLVTETDRALIRCAECLSSFARTPSVDEKLRRLGPNEEELSEESQFGLELSTGLPLELSAVESIAERPWHDLVSASDYFFPVTGLNLKNPADLQWGMFSTFFNPQLRPPGDFVSRGLQIRLDHWNHYLRRFWVRCHTIAQRYGEDASDSWHQVTAVWAELQERITALRAMCFSGSEARLRDSCIALLQVMVGCRPDIDIRWLGVPAGLERNIAGMPNVVKRRHNLTIADRVAAALADVADMMRRPPTPDEVIESKRRTHDLVLVAGPGLWQMFWKGDECGEALANKKAPREFLWALAQRAKTNQCVEAHLWRNQTMPLKDRRFHLRGRIPERLRDRIKSVGDGAYKLNVPGESICLLLVNEENTLREFDCLHTLPF